MSVLPKLAHRMKQLYSNLLPIHCLLCGVSSSTLAIEPKAQLLCADCINDLPTLGTACPRCATPLSTSASCGQCLSNPLQQDATVSVVAYQYPANKLIADFKYHHKLYLSELFADLLVEKVVNKPLPSLLIPIPLHPNRLKQRGYNQSLELAKSLSQKLNIPINKQILTRTRDTASQSSVPYDTRKKNIRGAFDIAQAPLPNHVVLIDDVLTTGHTANAAVKLLRQQGVDLIEVWTIARTIRDH